jgi:hypothetical protein
MPVVPAPITYAILKGTIYIVLQGTIDDPVLLHAQHEIFDDPAFDGRYPRLVDGTGIKEWLVHDGMVKHVAKCAYERGLRRAALVSNNNDLVQRMMLLYAVYAGDAVVEVFRNREVASRWLSGVYTVE